MVDVVKLLQQMWQRLDVVLVNHPVDPVDLQEEGGEDVWMDVGDVSTWPT